MITDYATMDMIQILEIFLAKNILKSHHGLVQLRNSFFFDRSHGYEEMKTKAVCISNPVSSVAQRETTQVSEAKHQKV